MNLQPSEAEASIDIQVPPTTNQKSLERNIAEDWAPSSCNMTFEVVNYRKWSLISQSRASKDSVS